MLPSLLVTWCHIMASLLAFYSLAYLVQSMQSCFVDHPSSSVGSFLGTWLIMEISYHTNICTCIKQSSLGQFRSLTYILNLTASFSFKSKVTVHFTLEPYILQKMHLSTMYITVIYILNLVTIFVFLSHLC